MAGTSVSLSTTTDVNGSYSFSVPARGTYTVTPSLAGYAFSPASQTFSNLGANQTAPTTIAQPAAPPFDPGSAAISGSPGVPLHGNSYYQVNISGTSQAVATLIPHGSGTAVFDDGSTTKVLSGSTTLIVSGRSSSSNQNDIELRITSASGHTIYTTKYLSVVSVSISVNTSSDYDSDDYARFNMMGGNTGLDRPGSTIFTLDGSKPFCGELVEYVGTVTPSDYSSPIVLSRYLLGYAVYSGSIPGVVPNPPSKNDTSLPGYRVDIPVHGKIFDVDVPGIQSSGYLPDGSFAPPARQRANFIEYAVLDSAPSNNNYPDSLPNLVSSFFYTGSAVSCVGDDRSPRFATDVFGDNVFYRSSIALSWDLK